MTTESAVFNLFKNDATLRALLGGSGTDARIYREYPGHRLPSLTAATPGYVIFSRESAPAIGGSGMGEDELWQAHIRAKDPDTRDLIQARVRALVRVLTRQQRITLAGRYHLGGGDPRSGPDLFDEELQAYIVNVRFRLESIEV